MDWVTEQVVDFYKKLRFKVQIVNAEYNQLLGEYKAEKDFYKKQELGVLIQDKFSFLNDLKRQEKDMTNTFLGLIKTFNEKDAYIFIMRFIKHIEPSEIAKAVGWRLETTENKIKRLEEEVKDITTFDF